MEDEFNYINCVRLFADLSVFDNPKNSLNNETICIRAGDSVRFDVVLLNNSIIADCTNIVSASFEIMDIGEINRALPRNCKTLFKKEILAESINKNITQAEIDLGKCHFSVPITSSQAYFTAGDKYLKISAYLENGNKLTFSSGWIYVAENFEADLCDNPQQSISIASELQGQIHAQNGKLNSIFAELYDLTESSNNLQEQKADKFEVASNFEFQNLNINNLQMFKANTGALHFSGASSIKLNSNQNVKEFCWCYRFKVSADNWSTLSAKNEYIVANKFSASSTGFGLRPSPDGSLAFQYCGSNGNKTIFTINASTMANYTNDTWHFVVLCGFNNEARIYFDGKLIASGSVVLENITPMQNFQILSKGACIQYADVFHFNFDVTSADALYTIEDYQQGKPIPPKALNGFTAPMASFFKEAGTTASATYSNGVIDYTGTTTATSVITRVRTPFVAKAGDKIRIVNTSATLGGNGKVFNLFFRDDSNNEGISTGIGTVSKAVSLLNANDVIVELTRDITKLAFVCETASSGSIQDVSASCDIQVEKVGTLLALEDYTINGKVLDYSGNKNNATITGSVQGDNDTRIEAFVETITTSTSEQN